MSTSQHPLGHVLQAYHDQELDSAETAAVAEHCEQCRECQEELVALAETAALLATSPAPELPRTVWHRVRPSRRVEPRFKPAFALAAGLAGIALGVLLGPIQFDANVAETESSWAEVVMVWDGGASSTLLDVYQSSQE